MSGLAVAVILAAPLLTPSAEDLDVPTLEPVSLVEYVNTPDAPDPPPVAVQVPDAAVLPMELAAVTVTPKPPPPPPRPAPIRAASPSVDWIAIARDAPNGEVPREALCNLSWDANAVIRCDAAAGLERAADDGMPRVPMTSTYRTYADQVAMKASRGSFAAAPGTSDHGWGVAIDIPEPARSWLLRSNGAYGWVNPLWARGYEPWHFVFPR